MHSYPQIVYPYRASGLVLRPTPDLHGQAAKGNYAAQIGHTYPAANLWVVVKTVI